LYPPGCEVQAERPGTLLAYRAAGDVASVQRSPEVIAAYLGSAAIDA
jgi:hypothetical protein